MNHSRLTQAALTLAFALATSAHAQDAASSYRAPLADDIQALASTDTTRSAQDHAGLPVFPVEPGPGQRAYRAATVLVAQTAVAVASEKLGTTTPLPSQTYQPYRPGVSVPEPRTTEKSCPPLGTPGAPVVCSL